MLNGRYFLSCLSLIITGLLLASGGSALADDTSNPNAGNAGTRNVSDDSAGRFEITEENDFFASDDDRHYTQGLELNYLSGAVDAGDFWDRFYNFTSRNSPIFEDGTYKRKTDWHVLGQVIFTPTNTAATVPSTKDRPYGAWLYTGMSLLQDTANETHHTLENFEVMGGVVGPLALGALTQNDFHEMIGVQPSAGWENQLHTEPGLDLSYERKWRFEAPIAGNLAVDAIPEAGATVGNVYDYADTGITFRFGQNLNADYGVNHIGPSLSGTPWFDKDQLFGGPVGWYLYGGTQGRAVGRNIFLDGNSFASSPSVDKRILVEDFVVGASVFWSDDVRVDFSATERTKEFYGQQGSNDRFGTINVAFGF